MHGGGEMHMHVGERRLPERFKVEQLERAFYIEWQKRKRRRKGNGRLVEMDEEKLVLTIDEERRVFLGEAEVPPERLEEALLNNARVQEDDEIYVRADASVEYGFVLRVFTIIRQAGVEKLGLVTDPAGGAAPAPQGQPDE